MVTSEPNSGSVGESPTPVDTVPEPGGGEDPPRPPSVATTEASGMDGTQEEASMDVAQEEGGSPDVSVVKMLQISQNSPPKRNECVTCTHSMGVLTSGGGLRDYHDPSICAVQLLRQCLLRFGVTRIPPYILPCVVLRAPIANKRPVCIHWRHFDLRYMYGRSSYMY